MYTFAVLTKRQFELVTVTRQVTSIVRQSGVKSGIATIALPHTTAAVVCNEAVDDLAQDIVKVVRSLKAHADFFGNFAHNHRGDGNAHAHIASTILGNSRSFIIHEGKLQLGAWQSIMLLEMDGPRTREVWVKIIKEE